MLVKYIMKLCRGCLGNARIQCLRPAKPFQRSQHDQPNHCS